LIVAVRLLRSALSGTGLFHRQLPQRRALAGGDAAAARPAARARVSRREPADMTRRAECRTGRAPMGARA
jgi:hypothetical protein